MEAKPAGWSATAAAVFADEDVVAAYALRPPYPDETIARLAGLAGGGPVLDAGCGTGELARRLAPLVERVDGVDASAAMVAEARRLPGGAAVRWLHGRVEEAPVEPPYALVVAGDSVHWFDWDVALPRFCEVLRPGAPLAVVRRDWLRDEQAFAALRPVYARHSWNVDYAPLDPVEELERRGAFRRLGEHASAPAPWRPTLDELVEGHFSMGGFARSRIADPAAFAAEVRAAVAETLERAADGRYDLDVAGTVVWGLPAPS